MEVLKVLCIILTIIYFLDLIFIKSDRFYIMMLKHSNFKKTLSILIKIGKFMKHLFIYLLHLLIVYSVPILVFTYHLLAKNIIGYNIVGILVIIIFIYSFIDTIITDLTISKSRVSDKKFRKLYTISCILDLLIPIVISTILILKIDCDSVQEVILSIFSALFGGGITFAGVWITIKRQENKQKEDKELQYKPYLMLTNKHSDNTLFSEMIKDTFNQENIDFEKTKYFYVANIETVYIMNSSNAECIIKEIVIDNVKYKIDNKLILKNEIINLCTTRNVRINLEKQIESVFIVASDVLNNNYIYKCTLKSSLNPIPGKVTYENGKELNFYEIDYKITNIGLPEKSS